MKIGILSAQLDQESIDENKRLVREIRLRGHRAQIINYHKTVLLTSGGKAILYQPDETGALHQIKVDAVIPRINEVEEQSISLGTVALESLIASGVYATATPSAIRLSKNKIASLMVLAKVVPVPRSAAITGAEPFEVDIDRVLKAVEPNVAKRLIVKTNLGTHGKGVMAANSHGEARAILDGFMANNIPVLIQQFVEPTKKGCYTDIRLIVVGGKVVAVMQRVATKKNEIRANIAQGGEGLLYKASEAETQMALSATRAMGLGVAGVDIIPSGSKRVVIEVNSSPGFSVEKITGMNITRKIVSLAIVGARRGEKTASEKFVQKLNTPINIKKMTDLPKGLEPLKKIKTVPSTIDAEIKT